MILDPEIIVILSTVGAFLTGVFWTLGKMWGIDLYVNFRTKNQN